MRTSNIELLAEIDGLAQMSSCETDELEVVKHIDKIEAENKKLKEQISEAVGYVHSSELEDIGYNVLCALGEEC